MDRIVVIDDDPLALERVAATLRLKGFAVESASRGAAGLALVQQHLPDLVLCDVNMPGLSGYDVLHQVRGDPRTTDVPFVFLTGLSERENLRRGMILGADDYLTKPFTTEELLQAIYAQLEKRRAIQQKYETTLNLLRQNIVYALPHELRTPLTGSLGFAELLRLDAESLSPSEIRDIAERIITHNQRLHRVLENFLVYAQIEVLASDPQQVERLRSHITPRVGHVIGEVARQRAEEWRRTGDLLLQLADLALRIAEHDLRKVIAELVDNAFKFSPAGAPVEVSAGRDGDRYIIQVSDRGRGMTPDQLAAIGAYMQFDRVIYEQQGLGLGLTIARRLTELHGGQFAVYSERDYGTEVRLIFPLYT